MTNLPKKIIVVGASAGGLKALGSLLAGIPPGLDIALFVVVHLSRKSMGDIVAGILQRATSYTCKVAADGEQIRTGTVYIAPPDHHMLVLKESVKITKGTHENRWRPSIDVLFRSAAVAYDSQLVGIVLTGLLDDGTSGMYAVKRCGGTTIVQEPDEAEFEDMPRNVLNNVEVDYRVPVGDMGYIIADLLTKPAGPVLPIPESIQVEARITERMASSIDEVAIIGEHTTLTCPDCGGGLWKIKDDAISRFRCHTGHVYTQSILEEKQSLALEESLWVAIRMMEERKNFLLLSIKRDDRVNPDELALLQQRAGEMNRHIDQLRKVMMEVSDSAGDIGGLL